jgi:hypothetical protein
MPFVHGYENRTIEVLKAAEMPLDIENVRRRAGIRNWQTAKALLFELLARGNVSAIKTSKSWIFWVEGAAWLRPRSEAIQAIDKQRAPAPSSTCIERDRFFRP